MKVGAIGMTTPKFNTNSRIRTTALWFMSLIYRRSGERGSKINVKKTYAVVGPLRISAMVDWGKDDFFISCFSTKISSETTTTPSSTPSSLFEDIVRILKIWFLCSVILRFRERQLGPVECVGNKRRRNKYTHTAAAAAASRERKRERDEGKKIWEWWIFFFCFCVCEGWMVVFDTKKRKISRTHL